MVKMFCVLFMVFFLSPLMARAGVTIHYSGSVESAANARAIVDLAEKYAKNQGWKTKKVKEGIVFYPHPWCEPLNFAFENNKMKADFVKTQFAGAEVHKTIIELFREIRSMMSQLEIIDEGEYWETGNVQKLAFNIESVNVMMKNIKTQKSGVKGPRKLPNGRIIDLYQ